MAAALSTAAAVVALAAGAPPRAALAAALAWTLSFAAATLGVHAVLARARARGARDPGPAHAAGVAALAVLVIGLR